MPKTRAELLAAAEESIDHCHSIYWPNEPQVAQTAALHAIACILLAQERRMDEERAVVEPKEGEKP